MALRGFVFFCAVLTCVAVACRMSPAKPCRTNADCGRYGTCNLATNSCFGPSGPSLTLHIDAPPARPPDALGTTWTDTQGNAWRRNETLVLKASSEDTDVASLTAYVSGVLADGSPDVEVALGEMTPTDCATLGIEAAYCVTISVPLAQPPLPMKRGDFQLRVEGTNAEGGIGEVQGGVTVTRFAWRHDAGAPLKVTPAVGSLGVYLARSAANGNVRALSAAGEFRWNSADTLGDIKTSPAVGAFSAGQETVYVGGAGAYSALYALRGTNGTRVDRCADGSSPWAGDFVGGIGLLQTTAGAVTAPTAVSVVNTPALTLVAIRAGA
ncbi:MAG: hypothetical protein ACKVPX_06730, partial [Myxococcaceae bacterium]